VDDKASAEDINALVLTSSTSDEIIGISKVTSPVDKTQDKKNPPLI
jgi:hypothetical protein